MKTIILTLAASIALAAGTANAAEFVTDPLLKDLASTGHVINPHGFGAAGR